MYNYHTLPTIFFVIVAIVVFSYLLLAFVHRKELFTSLKTSPAPLPDMRSNSIMGEAFPGQLIDKPINGQQDHATISLEEDPFEDHEMELANDSGTVLLKEAEKIVEQIQDTVNHIASNPPNSEEVFSKIKSIVSRFRIFENTEYYDAINSFIAITIERDCSIQSTPEEIRALWN